MSVGLQIFDANGNIILDATYRVMRIVGTVPLSKGYSSSLYDARLEQGGWVAFQPSVTLGDGYMSGGVIAPTFSISGGTLTWSYPAMNNTQYDTWQDGVMFYGA